ncbi:cyclopropane-fatty-acyl-phospholipid synthase [Cryphonectria parasitica EP155]|uniref:Cyclopropane-fatty-acyl-phospholipid synthase n=1 Tax=Cryphonectria parasitica (strain ATCC 38755 / EP155) TaxID=660469 RepID=A0A9P4Y4L7_CRYP1|nr:cyclopropane-fatty-acyl-phospholipid synthase [Cryphonectria parasitica EP155]KAF3766854.1 cyclopropane-fatty-acyl-phospholipid synthase [Cryphonectria parasitica EP155]
MLGNKKSAKPTTPTIKIQNEVFWLRVLAFGDIGFSQSYMLREISTSDLTSVLKFFIHNKEAIYKPATVGFLPSLFGPILKRVPFRTLNHIGTSRLNAAAHYSLSNDMFKAFLSPDMTYSAPIWLPPSDPLSKTESLEDAQRRKLRYAVSAARIVASDHVLEIGTGWGSFAITAAQTTGCHVTTVTPSAEQKRLAEERVRAAGLEDKISVVQADYRELGGMGAFDKIVSIEMIEHVGHDFLDTYFSCVDQYLKKDGGIGFFQCITIPEARYEQYRHSQDFIKKYIFPGGHLPTVTALVDSINRGSMGGLIVEEIRNVGMHYPKALRCWDAAFQEAFDGKIVPALKESQPEMTTVDMEVFRRKWHYYFCYCEAGFETKALGDVAITVGRENCLALLQPV